MSVLLYAADFGAWCGQRGWRLTFIIAVAFITQVTL